MDSKDRQQMELLPRKEGAHVEPVGPELIRSIRTRRTFLAAWNFAQDFSGLEHKECYGPLHVDPSHWTKIRSGTAGPPADERFDHYLDVVQNEIPLIWWAEKRGYDWLTIRKHRSDQERRIAELETENRDLKRAMTLWVQAGK